jgi:hypothetical protein
MTDCNSGCKHIVEPASLHIECCPFAKVEKMIAAMCTGKTDVMREQYIARYMLIVMNCIST